MTESRYSVGRALSKLATEKVLATKIWAELAVSVNSTLFKLNNEVEFYKEPVILIKSNKYRDILNLIVLCLFIEEEEVKFLLKAALAENSTVKTNKELELFLFNERILKEFLVNTVHSKGFNYLFSIINFKQINNNKLSVLSLIKFKKVKLGSDRNSIPEKRRIGVGYRDKGSLPEVGASAFRAANTDKELQNRIEENRRQISDFKLILEGLYE